MKSNKIASFLLLLFFIESLYAQEVEKRLDTVTVSANKIEENIQDVPQSILVLEEEVLEEKGIENISDAIKEVPNMITSGSNNGIQASFRGLNLSTFTNNNPVVIYIDGVPYYDRYDFDPSLANVAQIEILRGPQGTLYGKDAIGAVINIITKKPTNEWHGSIGARYGKYNLIESIFNTSGALIKDKIYAGINGSFTQDDGWITNHYPGMEEDADRDKQRKLSAFLLFKPTDRLSGKVIVSDNHAKTYWMDGLAVTDSTPLNDIKRSTAEDASFEVPTYEDIYVKSQSLNLTYDMDKVKIQSTTTHKKADIDGDYDADYLSGQGLNDGLRMFNYTDIETWTQELKLSGVNDNLKWVSGIYADKEDRDIGPYGQEMESMGAIYLGDAYAKSNAKTQAIFGQVMLPFAKKFELTLGGRYQKIKKEIDLVMYQTWGGSSMPGSPFYYKDEKTWNTFLPKIALSYKYNDNLTTFASVSKGYMPGGFNYYALSGGSEENSFEPQKSTDYEIGVKYTGEMFLFNVSVFRMNIKDIHIYKSLGGTIWLTDNAKEAHTQGIEIDGKYFITNNIELSGALGFIDAKYDDYDTGAAKYDGQRIENTPRYTANLGVAYIPSKGLYGRVDFYARGKTNYFDGATNSMVSADGAIMSDLKIGYKIKEWDIYGYVKNITDEEYVSSYRSRAGLRIIGFNEPRTFGVGVRYKF